MNILDNRYYNSVIEEMQPFFDEHDFKACEDGSFANDTRAAKIDYNEERQMYILSVADVSDGSVGEYSELSSWLFDDSQNAKDAVAVGVDFTATLRENMGIKIKRKPVTDVDLPTAQKSGALTVAGFTKKVLDVFPQYKDDYKEHVAKYGNFLYMDFYSETLVPQIKNILSENAKKTVKKLYELLELGYVQGDRDTVNIVVASLAAAVQNDTALQNAAFEMLSSNLHFKQSVEAFIPVLKSKKKLAAALVK